jgi:MoaA/NifB/PqqE/SkfB family radical SAM enzyme
MLAIIIPTNRCNLRCKHCLRSNYEGEDLRLDDLRKFLQGFEEYHLGNKFVMTGGEFTLHDDFAAIFRMLEKFDFKSGSVVTNGQNVEKIDQLCKFKHVLSHVLLSLEGPNTSINDKIRGTGSFDKALKTINVLNKNKIPVYIRTTLNSININFIEEMIHFSASKGIGLMHFSIVHPCVKGEKNKLHLTQEEMEEGYRKYKKVILKYPDIKTMYNHRNFMIFTEPEWRSYGTCRPIGSNTGELVLMPNGSISFCCDLSDYDFYSEDYNGTNQNQCSHILGNIRKDDFGDILERRKKLIAELVERRIEDAEAGELKGRRRFICENCKFYFFYKS